MMQLQTQSHISVDGTPFKQVIPLKHISHLGILEAAVGIVEQDRSALRGQEACNDGQKSGFPTAAWAYDGDKFALTDTEGDIL